MNKDEFMRKVTLDYNYTFEQARKLWSVAEACLGNRFSGRVYCR